MVSDEDYSEKSLNLMTQAIRYNQFNYNFWIVRRNILNKIHYDPFKELCWLEEMIVENPKNFQCWEHRRFVINKNLNSCTSAIEFKLTEQVLLQDPKNYFAWHHRQFVISTFKYTNLGILTDEMKFTDGMIKEDIRNNSAWNQRYFIINQRGKTDFILVKTEFRYAFEKIKMANENDSSWNYIRGLLLNFGTKRLWQFEELVKYCETEFYENENTNRHLVAFLIDLKIEMILDDSNDAIELLISQKISNLCTLMAHKYDKIRKNYWQFVYKHFCFEKIVKRDTMNDSFNNEGGVKKDDSWKGRFAKKANDTELSVINELKIDKKKKSKKLFHKKK